MTSSSGSDNDATPNGLGPQDPTPEQESNAVERLIERFGGIRPMAAKLDIPVTTVQGWKKRGAIPAQRHADLSAAAAKHGIALSEGELEATLPKDEHGATVDSDTDTPVTGTGTGTGTSPSEPVLIEGVVVDPDKDQNTSSAPLSDSATASGPEAAKASASPSSSGNTVAIVALLVGLAALSEPWWGPAIPGWPRQAVTVTQTTPVPEIDPQLIVRFEQLADRVNELERHPVLIAGVQASPTPAEGQANEGPANGERTMTGVDQASFDSAMKSLQDRLNELEKATGEASRQAASAEQSAQAVASAPAPAAPEPQPDPRIGQLSEKLAGLEQTLSGLTSDRNAADQLRSDLEGVKSQLGTLASEVETRRDTDSKAQALVLAAGQLRAALALGQPFAAELKAVRALGISDAQVTQALDTVSSLAEKGIPTQTVLTDRFLAQTSEIVRVDAKGNHADWIDQVTGTLSALVTVRRQGGNVVGDSADAIVARTEAALRDGDLPRAVAELSVLSGPATSITGPWLNDAKARLAANQAAQQLTSRAIALLSGETENGQ